LNRFNKSLFLREAKSRKKPGRAASVGAKAL
jgi:hypothetical protein